ncbi:DUF2971 domain-containing protein [Vibrio mediterranei]|uniref:DUF2971 domain-containing protein n=1 Tax=Vibrio mediterranei TaxID=689 RepID=UPI000D183585|nr:DUF2971 domain-containing protein [Vibrio mediterranei]PTC01884.1 DUF2971 domain-containing protein [Vibrio mediterranei]
MSIPEKLYKYETVSIQSLLNLKSQTVYFAPPSGFNDPYDCAIKAQLKDPTPQEFEELRNMYLAKPWPKQVMDKLTSTPFDELAPMLVRAAREANEKIVDRFIDSRGVSCFSEVCDELLMWAHYADKYSGFCLEFQTDNELFEHAKKVVYVDEMPKLDVLSIYGDGRRGDILELFCTKSKSWEYEREWRCIHSEAGTAYTYPAEALKGVYFGPNINPEMLEIICLILQGQNSEVKFWKGKRSESSFKVEFEEFFYTPYLKAKELGLRT